MSKVIKQMELDAMKKTFTGVRDLIMMKVVGLDAISDNQVRLGLRKKGIRLQMVKNSLARRIFSDMGMPIDAGWEGSTTLAWGGTSIAALSKEIETLAKKHEKFIKVKSAVADGQSVSFELALKMPTREEAIGRVIGLALAPASRLVSQILSPGGSLAGQIKTISERKEEAAAPATA